VSPKRVSKPLDIYVRVSDVKGRAGDSFISPKDQEERCRALAQSRDFKVGEVLTDLDVSGGKMRRPQLDRAITRIEDGTSGGIIVAKLDRFARTLVGGLQTLEQINDLDGVVIVADGEFDTSTATGELVLNMMLSLAQFELRRIRESWQGAKRHAVDRGIHIAPRIPPGYRRDEKTRKLVPDGKHAKTMTLAFSEAANGATYARIAELLNSRSLPVWSGEGTWQPNRIKRLLANRVYLGEARSGNGHVNADAHKALVSEPTWNLAQRRAPKGPALSARAGTLLAGLCRCASCSFAMRSQGARKRSVPIYRCTTTTLHGRCPAPTSISEKRVNDYVLEQFLAHTLVSLEQAPALKDDDVELALAAAEAERSYRDALTNVELRAKIGATDHDRMVGLLYDAWQRALAAIPATPVRTAVGSVDLEALVAELRERGDLHGLRELLGASVQAVFVRPAASRSRTAPIEDRVHIVWTDEPPLSLPKRGERFEPRRFTWDQ
jgi:DNA invertase Pin-like site-specific DNA recombinase